MPDTAAARPRRRGLAWRVAVVAAAVAVCYALLAPGVEGTAAVAAPGDIAITAGELAVTFVARGCGDYPDIMANRARNNIQESLRDLGKDTVYSAGQPISPAIEAPNQPNCATPLRDWQFQLGTGYTGKTPETSYLSTVTGAYPAPITTGGPIPELDPNGVDTGRTIDGAVTVVLSPEQAQRAQSGQALWTQGGRVEQTLPPGNTFGFGALRCAVDNLNGDNVEFISYPTAARHVFCYYYAVAQPPPEGSITVVKQLAPGNVGSQSFPFEGNISYDRPSASETGRFTLSASATSPGSITFIRGAVIDGAEPWNFRELVPPGWDLVGTPSCESPLGSVWTYDETNGISVTLVADDAVVCTFTNTRELIAPSFLYKETLGSGGSFPFVVTPPPPAEPVAPVVDVPAPGTQVVVAESITRVPGTYTATETLPVVGYGTWELQQVLCSDGTTTENVPFTSDGQQRTASRTIPSGVTATCIFTNVFASDGAIGIRKTSRGGVGTFTYAIVPLDPETTTQYSYDVTTDAPDTPTDAEPVPPSGSATNLPIGSTWEVQEFLPAETQEGYWRVVSAACGPEVRGTDLTAATVRVQITEQNPEVLCDFTNEFVSLASLEVVKATSPDEALRPDEAVLAWACDDGTADDLPVAPGSSGATTGAIGTVGYLECTVTEAATGAAAGVAVGTTATITVNGEAAPYTLGDPFQVEPLDVILVEVDNVLTAPPPPTPPPTPTPSPLAATGSDFDAFRPTVIALLAIALGAASVLVAARAHRRRS